MKNEKIKVDNHIQNNIQFVDCLEFWVSNAKSFIKSFLQPMNFEVIGMRFNQERSRIQYLLLNNVLSRDSLHKQFQIENNSYIKPMQGNQFIKVTSSISPNDFDFHSKHQRHGDFIQNISFYCNDINLAYNKSINNGAKSVQLPMKEYFKNCRDTVETAIIESPFKDLQHTFINRNITTFYQHDNNSNSFGNPLFLYPEFEEIKDKELFKIQDKEESMRGGTGSLDHIATCIKNGEMGYFVEWYRKCLGFKLLSDSVDESENLENELILDKNFYVITKSDFKYTKKENIGLKMAVLSNQPLNTPYHKTPPIQFVISEAIQGGEGQIEQFIHYFGGEGVQHLAFNSNSIFKAVEIAKSQKLEFVYIPQSYYSKLDERLIHLFPNSIPKILKENLMRFGILIDSDAITTTSAPNEIDKDSQSNNNIEINQNIGYIKQIFTKYITDRPTMFFELIERSNALGFGKGNIIALFESLEKESTGSQ
ncbi:hypothetical protein RB653_010628 [Dictyostelium firmibasis]|uniref:VOC domain-containing protein n=1 Tax=Dictyostelium firmibasis TaxID=79012 RepID=A0AAN7TLX2_9MYCE